MDQRIIRVFWKVVYPLGFGFGADFAYIGTKFIATAEANASPGYKQMIAIVKPTTLCTVQHLLVCMGIT